MDIAGAIQDHVEGNGFVVVEDFTGHGVVAISMKSRLCLITGRARCVMSNSGRG